MTREEFEREVSTIIETAIMQAQGMMDWRPMHEPKEIAEHISSLLPDGAFP